MPNYCENKVRIFGDAEDLAELKTMIGTDDKILSFYKILPFPEDFNREASIFYHEALYGNWKTAKAWGDVPDSVTNREELFQYYENESSNWQSIAKQAKANMDNYGVRDCRDLFIRYWGVQWDVHSDHITFQESDEELYMDFLTALVPPCGIYDAIIKMIKDHRLSVYVSWFYHEPANELAGYLHTPDQDEVSNYYLSHFLMPPGGPFADQATE